MSREKLFVIIISVIGGVAGALALTSAILFSIGGDGANAVGIASTILSVLLSLVSIIYTYFSGKITIKNLAEIKNQNDELVKKIIQELGKDNYDEANIADIRNDE